MADDGASTVAPGTLVLVATPIGNLGDLPPRAVDTLRAASLICCEDTRRTGRLLQHAGVSTRMAVANEHTEYHRIGEMLGELGAGHVVAVVSDAGTPGLSDPGERLVRAALDAGFSVSAIPGPAAAITALVISGLPTERFVFEGFLPRTGRARQQRIAEISAEPRTIVLYEAPHRIARTIADLAVACGDDRRVAVARELTKLYEDVKRSTLGDLDLGEPRGEYVIVLAGKPEPTEPPDDDVLRDALRTELEGGHGTKAAAAAVAERYGVAKRTTYALAVDLDRYPRSHE
jgi:16S rRNA (cytidine1402-2'-O)-methyltransferase